MEDEKLFGFGKYSKNYYPVNDEALELIDEKISHMLLEKHEKNPFSNIILNTNFEFFVDSLLNLLYLSDIHGFYIFIDSVWPKE